MSFYSTLKKIDRANKRAVRNSERRRRELNRIQKANQRLAEAEAAQLEVDLYENRIEVLRSIHMDCNEPIDWEGLLTESPPFPQNSTGPNERVAIEKLSTYKPGLRDKLFGRGDAQKEKLQQDIETAKKEDLELYKEWEERVSWAQKILSGDAALYIEVMKEMDPFQDVSEIGSSIDMKVLDADTMEATVYVQSEEVIPSKVKSVTAAGKLSEKNMPKGAYYELYQDYVCGVTLRVAREIFAALPVSKLYLHAVGESLNTSTGHTENNTILSTLMDRDTVESLNYSLIDPSDSMVNFEHKMKFQKTKGMLSVDRITIHARQGGV
ncbi:hypothetical protein AWH48_11320 [Domibacillus aminovorans]|uniref:Uncharacterized protein n=1 Tax=Domibacillus aminovorans TaxID=29332 RepID=A0A177KL35_9BACI|nr:hypothetical protein [Domibacillus aminovorans]OAH53854.1 hypothetical protein AWH48_11320 [Domibacillus aminovorans]